MGFLFGTHDRRFTTLNIPEPRFLADCAPLIQYFGLPSDLILDRVLHILEGVNVLQLDFRPKLLLPRRTQRQVRLTPKAPLLHVAVTDVKVH